MGLITDLPDDITRECLLRSSYKQFPAIASVCKSWKREVSLPEFFRRRRSSRHSQKLLVMTQARADPVKDTRPGETFHAPVYRISVLEADSGIWSELPLVPVLPNGLPLFCRLATVGSDLVVLGGLDPVTWQASDSVFIFSFLTSTWRVGTSMPGVPRSFFGCASDSVRMVFVAGGHDEDKAALTSAIAYDVVEDRWFPLPDMARERDECAAILCGGRFQVIGGYATDAQGQFSKSIEIFDIATWQWGPVVEDFLPSTTRPPVCAADENGELYACHGGEAAIMKDDTWQHLGRIPDDVSHVAYMAAWEGTLMVIGSARFGDPMAAYAWDLKSCHLVKLDTHESYSGHVQSASSLEL